MLLDTSGLLSLLSPREANHGQAKKYYQDNRPSFTHSLILAELVALAAVRGVPRHMVLQVITDLMTAPATEIVWVDRSLMARAIALLQARQDKAYSLADTVSFVMMRDRGISNALTTDRHFEQEGFGRLLSGDNASSK